MLDLVVLKPIVLLEPEVLQSDALLIRTCRAAQRRIRRAAQRRDARPLGPDVRTRSMQQDALVQLHVATVQLPSLERLPTVLLADVLRTPM